MSLNSFGHIFKVSTWGESHGPAIGTSIDGCPSGIELTEDWIQTFLNKRRPAQNKFTTQRKEMDIVKILSGVFNGKTTGTPIQLLIENTDHKSKDYNEISEKFRPGHADLTYFLKYGIRDYRGGGRSSARETASRVAAGGVARAVLKKMYPDLKIIGYMKQIGNKKIKYGKFDSSQIHLNPFWCPDPKTALEWAEYLSSVRKSGGSVGAMIEVLATGVPPGIGAPVYAKLDSDIASGMMSINAVKGVEIGAGMKVAEFSGEQNADEIHFHKNSISFSSNHSGGILGGISTGQDIIVRFSVKPTSSILSPKKTITRTGEATEIVTRGRHDPCVGIRAVPVGEAMMSCILLDHILLHRGQNGENKGHIGKKLTTFS